MTIKLVCEEMIMASVTVYVGIWLNSCSGH
jgi:hypothetical protein